MTTLHVDSVYFYTLFKLFTYVSQGLVAAVHIAWFFVKLLFVSTQTSTVRPQT